MFGRQHRYYVEFTHDAGMFMTSGIVLCAPSRWYIYRNLVKLVHDKGYACSSDASVDRIKRVPKHMMSWDDNQIINAF